ncbi:MAG: phosphoglucosamine mutase [Planctomycetaceae bacterium]
MAQRILSISGLRGVIGDGLDPEHILRFAAALGTMVKGGTVVLSRDGRATGEMIRDAVVSAPCATGCTVLDAGIASTPTCGVLVQHLKAAAGLQVTASHNPIQWNGLKPFSPAGSVFDHELGAKFMEILNSGEFQYQGWEQIGKREVIESSWKPHFEKILDLVDVELIKSRKFKVVLDCNHGAGGVLGPILLNELGCEVQLLGGTPDGQFEHTPEPTEENCHSVGEAIVKAGADVGFVQDPDADRLAIIDEQGKYIGEELTLALCVDHVLPKRPGPVVVNGSTSRVTADIAQKYNCPFHRSYVGEANVVAMMRESFRCDWWRREWGIDRSEIGWVRDSFLAMAYVLEHLALTSPAYPAGFRSCLLMPLSKIKLSAAIRHGTCGRRCTEEIFSDAHVQEGDGLRLDWDDRWVQVRASNTEPIMRIIAEPRKSPLPGN